MELLSLAQYVARMQPSQRHISAPSVDEMPFMQLLRVKDWEVNFVDNLDEDIMINLQDCDDCAMYATNKVRAELDCEKANDFIAGKDESFSARMSKVQVI